MLDPKQRSAAKFLLDTHPWFTVEKSKGENLSQQQLEAQAKETEKKRQIMNDKLEKKRIAYEQAVKRKRLQMLALQQLEYQRKQQLQIQNSIKHYN